MLHFLSFANLNLSIYLPTWRDCGRMTWLKKGTHEKCTAETEEHGERVHRRKAKCMYTWKCHGDIQYFVYLQKHSNWGRKQMHNWEIFLTFNSPPNPWRPAFQLPGKPNTRAGQSVSASKAQEHKVDSVLWQLWKNSHLPGWTGQLVWVPHVSLTRAHSRAQGHQMLGPSSILTHFIQWREPLRTPRLLYLGKSVLIHTSAGVSWSLTADFLFLAP